jgi:hypothetical protein
MTKAPKKGTTKKILKKKGNGQRARADKVQAQGTGRVPTRAFGGKRGTGLEGWDAFSPAHLPLPRSVGPYTVVRTTRLISSSARVNVFGTFSENNYFTDPSGEKFMTGKEWVTFGMLSSVTPGNPINAAGNTTATAIPFPGVTTNGSTLTAVPAAISVQIMNPNPLQATAGIVAGTVCSTQLDLRERTETWDNLGAEIVSYMRPRLLSAGKLALRGVQIDSYPLNMAACAEFRPVRAGTDGDITLNASSGLYPEGWAPIVIVNQGENLTLEFLVTIEWRVRFDIGNPAVSSHRHQGVTSDAHWDTMLRAAQSKMHGVCDIVERVANAGEAAANMAAAGQRAYRMLGPAARAPLALAG